MTARARMVAQYGGEVRDRQGGGRRLSYRPHRAESTDSHVVALTRIIHEGFYCNHRHAAVTSLTAGRLAARSVNILLGTGALFPGVCPRSESGTGTAADDGASPLTSARPSRLAFRRFRHEPS